MGVAVGVAQAAVGAIGAVSSMSAASKQAQLQKEQARLQLRQQKQQAKFQTKMAEIGFKRTRKDIRVQINEVNRIARWQTKDRMMAADQELASVRVRALERGVSGTTMSGFASTIAFLEGEDLKRIEKNRKSNVKAGERAIDRAKQDLKFIKKASKKRIMLDLANYKTELSLIENQQSVATTSAMLGAIGSGLQIAGGMFQQGAINSALTNPRYSATSTVTTPASFGTSPSAAYV